MLVVTYAVVDRLLFEGANGFNVEEIFFESTAPYTIGRDVKSNPI